MRPWCHEFVEALTTQLHEWKYDEFEVLPTWSVSDLVYDPDYETWSRERVREHPDAEPEVFIWHKGIRAEGVHVRVLLSEDNGSRYCLVSPGIQGHGGYSHCLDDVNADTLRNVCGIVVGYLHSFHSWEAENRSKS